jgi:hypothetical protein
MYLVIKEQESVGKLNENSVAVFRLTESGYVNVSGRARAGAQLPKGRYLIASIRRASTSPWYGGKFYVDVMYQNPVHLSQTTWEIRVPVACGEIRL